jgi:hypothetical protein
LMYTNPLTALPNGQFEEDVMAFLREQYGEVFVVERGSFNHLMSTVKRKFRRHTYIDMGATRARGSGWGRDGSPRGRLWSQALVCAGNSAHLAATAPACACVHASCGAHRAAACGCPAEDGLTLVERIPLYGRGLTCLYRERPKRKPKPDSQRSRALYAQALAGHVVLDDNGDVVDVLGDDGVSAVAPGGGGGSYAPAAARGPASSRPAEYKTRGDTKCTAQGVFHVYLVRRWRGGGFGGRGVGCGLSERVVAAAGCPPPPAPGGIR